MGLLLADGFAPHVPRHATIQGRPGQLPVSRWHAFAASLHPAQGGLLQIDVIRVLS